jgi:alpha-beta hydrolase superfamily lysophospholipase
MSGLKELGIIQPQGFPNLPDTWEVSAETVSASDGNTQLFKLQFRSKHETKQGRTLLIIHGMGEHAGRYAHFPHYLRDTVDRIVAYDLRGHGRSQGIRGHVNHFDELVEDAEMSLRRLHDSLITQYGVSRIHLFAHSMGGQVGCRLLGKHAQLPLKSASISAPFFKPKLHVPKVKELAAGLLSKAWGSLQLSTGLPAGSVSRDSAVVEAYQKDRLVHGMMTPQFYSSLVKTVNDTQTHCTRFSVPVQFQIPLDDQVVDPKISINYFQNIQCSEKNLKTYSDFYHEGMNDLGKEAFLADLREWIVSHDA